MISLLDPRLLLAFILAMGACTGAGYWKGGKDNEAGHVKAQLVATQAARETESEITRISNRDTSAYIGRIRKQQEKAHALPTIKIVNDCTVPADIGRVLNDSQRMPGDAGTGPDPGTTSTAADSTCAAELDIAKRNYAKVCVPNAEQLTEIQKRWGEVRSLLSQKGSMKP